MKHAGFTLIEIMVVVILFAFIGVIGVNLFSSTLRGASKTAVINEIKQSGSHAISIFERMIRNADEVVPLCDGSKANEVTIVNDDSNQTTFKILPDASLGINRIASVSSFLNGGIEQINLTSENITVFDPPNTSYFQCIRQDGISDRINIVLTLQQRGVSLPNEKKAAVKFQTSIGLRN